MAKSIGFPDLSVMIPFMVWAWTTKEMMISSEVYNNRIGLVLENVKNILETDLMIHTMMHDILDFKMVSKMQK